MRRAKADPDLSQKLSNGLSYLNADEMEEMQQALAMAIYAHSLTANRGGGYKAVKVRPDIRALPRPGCTFDLMRMMRNRASVRFWGALHRCFNTAMAVDMCVHKTSWVRR